MKRYIDYLKKVNNQLKAISRKENYPLINLYVDYAWCLIRHGCLVNQYYKGHFYKLSEIVRSKSFTQRRVSKMIRTYNDLKFIHILENKKDFNKFYQDFVNREWVYSKAVTRQEFSDFVKRHQSIFVKPIDDQEGNGIGMLEVSDHNIDSLFLTLKDKNVIIEEVLTQDPHLNLGNKSVNTARILTVTDSSGKAHVISAGLRAGTGDAVIDNFSAGGVLYEIDITTGKIDHKGIQGDNYDVLYHPGTDICMLGFQIPNWDKAIEGVVRAAEMLPQCRFIGWDVAFTPEGIELIEGNHNPGIFTLESLGTTGVYAVALKTLNQ